MSGVVRTLAIGSCVARDTFSRLPAERYELVGYVARQSLVSAYSPQVTLHEAPRLDSPFQQRMVRGDFASNLPQVLERHAGDVDLVLWDLTDERLGVYVLADDTAVTRSVDLIAADAEEPVARTGLLIELGTEAHLEMWRRAAARFVDDVRRLHPRARLVLVAPPWAERTESGRETPTSFRMTAARANELYEPYLDLAAGLPEVVPVGRGTAAQASDEHVWGEAPFHYTERLYRALTQLIDAGAPAVENPARGTIP